MGGVFCVGGFMNSISNANRRIFQIIPYILALVYAVVSPLSMFMNDDDYLWYFIGRIDSLDFFRNPNGRYLSNTITYYIVNYPILRFFFVSAVLLAFVFLIAKLIDVEKISYSTKLCFVLSAAALIPATSYCETIAWISGFTNYVFSVVLVLCYLAMVFNVLFSEKNFKPYCLILFPAIAISAGLCVEHVAIYDVFLGIAVIVLLKVRRKKFFIAPVLFFIFACISAFFMFTNGVYSDISGGSDVYGNRKIEISFSDFFTNTLRFVVPNYSKSFWIINIIIAAAVIILFCKKHDMAMKSKYSPVCLAIIVFYSLYSIYCSGYSDLRFLNSAMKVRGFETAFAFLYVISIAYFIWIFFDANRRIRLYIYILSTLMLTGPFIFISPVTARCFFVEYVFWILLSGELLFSALALLVSEHMKQSGLVGVTAAAALVFFILNVQCTNCYYAHLRYDYIKKQIEDGKKSNIIVVDYPYTEYTHDDMSESNNFSDMGSDTSEESEHEVYYFDLICKYYGFDGSGYSFYDFKHYSTIDYHQLEDDK